MITVILILAVGKQERDIALMLCMAGCIMVGIAAFGVLEPVLDFLYRLAELGDVQQGVLANLMKITGIGIISELAQMICRDSGNSALAQGMHLLGCCMILLLSLPLLETLLDIIQQILGEV